jgi:two-component system cell cycle response regulator
MDKKLLGSIRILYVEDDEPTRRQLTNLLNRDVKSLIVAANGMEGIEMFKAHNPDVVVTDIRMPVMDGLEMAKEIKRIDKDTPVILTTGYGDEEYFLAAIEIGIDRYLKKPINYAGLVEILLSAASSLLQRKEIEEKNEFIRNILDNTRVFIMVTDGREITYMNKALLDFTGCGSFEEFKNAYGNINEFLVMKPDSFYYERSFEEWIKEALFNRDREHIVYMAGKSFNPAVFKAQGAYALHVTDFPEHSKYIVSFVDVTGCEWEKQVYLDLALNDPLLIFLDGDNPNSELNREIQRAALHMQKMSLAVFETDNIRQIRNDYGYTTMEHIQQSIYGIIKESVRKIDVTARISGEKFIVIMAGADGNEAADMAAKVKHKIECREFPEVGVTTVGCTFAVVEHRHGEDLEGFIARAGNALSCVRR